MSLLCWSLHGVLIRDSLMGFLVEELENHMIDKKQNRVCVYGVFDPAEIAIKIRKKVRRRVEIMDVQELKQEL